MTCKDCLHYPACAAMFKRAWGELPETGEGAERCETFAGRSYYVVREKGKWTYDHWCEFKCSKCGTLSKTEPRGGENFCPNCGADMRGAINNGKV